jgi:DNA-binding MarR family transcriptional regulator
MSLLKPHLSAIQSRILVALFQSEGRLQFLPNEAVLEKTGVAQSTWSEEQKRLIEMGLLEKKAFKTIRTNNVCRIVNFRLTSKGRTVAFNLANISRMIIQQSDPLQPDSFQIHLTGKEFEYEVMESIEVALDSFGINLIHLVQSRLTGGIPWVDVARHPEKLTTILIDLFGNDGSSTVESMIADNLRSRFGEGSAANANDLVNLIAEFRQKRVTDEITQETSLERRAKN